MKKMLVSDYDGTFYLNEKDIKENIKEVKAFRKKGNLFLIATGNNYENFKKTVQKHNIEYDYLILDDGAVIVDKNDNVINTCFIEPSIVKKICEMIKNETDNISEFNQFQKETVYKENNITKISTRVKVVNQAKLLSKKINNLFKDNVIAYTMLFKDTNIVEIISSKTDKLKAIQEISNIEKIDKSNICVVGDGYNDINMIENYNGFCMENSVEELSNMCKNKVKSVADLIKYIEKSQ